MDKITAELINQNKIFDQLINERVRYAGIPPAYPFNAQSSTIHTKIAFIGSRKLASFLELECEVLSLDLINYKAYLRYAKPDFLLVESSLETSESCWSYSMTEQSTGFEVLNEVLKLSNDLNIPTVFWNTLDISYRDIFASVEKSFDYVFFADPRAGQEKQHIQVGVQFRIFNPFILKKYAYGPTRVLFDGISTLHRHSELCELLSDDDFNELKIIDSFNLIYDAKVSEIPLEPKKLLGSINFNQKANLLKTTDFEVFIDNPSITPLRQLQMIHEAAATGTIPVLAGTNELSYLSSTCSIQCNSLLDFHSQLHHITNEPELLIEGLKNDLWRQAYENHNFSTNFRRLISTIGLEQNTNELKVSVITPSFRENLINQVVQNYDFQTYKNKELIIILNSNHNSNLLSEIIDKREDIKTLRIPSENYAGSCIKQALHMSDSRLSVKMDDDDIYSKDHIKNIVYAHEITGAEVIGCPPALIKFQGDDELFELKKYAATNHFFKSSNMNPGGLWIGGNSISGKTSTLKSINFPASSYATADTSLLLGLKSKKVDTLILGRHQTIAPREDNTTHHTWRVSPDTIKSRRVISETPASRLLNAYKISFLNECSPNQESDYLSQKVSFCVASIPERETQLFRTIRSIINQADKIYVYLNNYTEIPSFLEHSKITYASSSDHGDLGAAGKFFFIDQINDGYVFTIDDDIIYPGDYASRTISTINKYKDSVAVCCHSSIFAPDLNWYFERTHVFPMQKGVSTDRFVQLAGTGTFAFPRKLLSISFDDLYPEIMCDLDISIQCKKQNIPIITQKRDDYWLKAQKIKDNKSTYYYKMLVNDQGRTKKAQKYDWSLQEHKKMLKKWLASTFPDADQQCFLNNDMDVSILCNLDNSSIPVEWDASKSAVLLKRKLQRLLIKKENLKGNYDFDPNHFFLHGYSKKQLAKKIKKLEKEIT